MLAILTITMPIFIIMAMGYFSVRFDFFTEVQLAGIGKFVIRIGLPMLVFHAITTRPLSDVINLNYLYGYGLASLLAFFAGWGLSRRRGQDATLSALNGLATGMSNTGFIGYPLLAMVIGPQAGGYLAMNALLENILVLPLMFILIDVARGGSGKISTTLWRVVKNLLKNPIIGSLLLALVFALCRIPVPAVVRGPAVADSVTMVGTMSAVRAAVSRGAGGVVGGAAAGGGGDRCPESSRVPASASAARASRTTTARRAGRRRGPGRVGVLPVMGPAFTSTVVVVTTLLGGGGCPRRKQLRRGHLGVRGGEGDNARHIASRQVVARSDCSNVVPGVCPDADALFNLLRRRIVPHVVESHASDGGSRPAESTVASRVGHRPGRRTTLPTFRPESTRRYAVTTSSRPPSSSVTARRWPAAASASRYSK